MANAKSAEQLAAELEVLETPGNLNSWEKKDTRFTNTILNEASSTEFSNQALSNIIRRDQNILEGINNRSSLVIASETPSDYEKLLYKMQLVEGNAVETTTGDLKKIYTRNSESKCFFLNAPWKYDDSPEDQFKKAISQELHTSTISSKDETSGIQPEPGQFFDILYDDQTQNTAKLIKKTRDGFVGIPGLSSSKIAFKSQDFVPAGDINITTSLGENSKALGVSKRTGALDIKDPPKESIVEEIKEIWTPEYNPVAVAADAPNPRTGSPFGPRFHPTKRKWLWHKGIDMTNSDPNGGWPIVAVNDGTITRISPRSGQPTTTRYAYVVIEHKIDSPYSVTTKYGHLFLIGDKDGIRLKKGNFVKAGQVIGYIGGGRGWPGSGNTTGVHLHFEVHVSKTVDGKKQYDKTTGTSGEKGNLEDLQSGAVNPIFFSYPNIAKFDKTKIPLLRSRVPTKIKEN